jgi:hypothetical protein
VSEHILSLLFFAAAMQGFFLAIVLGLHRRNTQANHVLAIFIALLSLDLLQQIYYAEALYKTFPQFICVINLLPLTYGGFLFLYVRSLTQATRLGFRDIVHFAFFIVGFIVSAPFLSLAGNEKLVMLEQMTDSNAPLSSLFFIATPQQNWGAKIILAANNPRPQYGDLDCGVALNSSAALFAPPQYDGDLFIGQFGHLYDWIFQPAPTGYFYSQ